jgi:hypothetical protein
VPDYFAMPADDGTWIAVVLDRAGNPIIVADALATEEGAEQFAAEISGQDARNPRLPTTIGRPAFELSGFSVLACLVLAPIEGRWPLLNLRLAPFGVGLFCVEQWNSELCVSSIHFVLSGDTGRDPYGDRKARSACACRLLPEAGCSREESRTKGALSTLRRRGPS